MDRPCASPGGTTGLDNMSVQFRTISDIMSSDRVNPVLTIARTVNTKEKVEVLLDRKGMSMSRLARSVGEAKQTVHYWLEHPEAPREGDDAWGKIARKLGVSPQVLLDDSMPLPEDEGPAPRLPVNANLLDMLFRVLENPEASPEDKAA